MEVLVQEELVQEGVQLCYCYCYCYCDSDWGYHYNCVDINDDNI